jgi:hypothetical protein
MPTTRIEPVTPRAPLIEALREELLAIPEAKLAPINVDLVAAAFVVLGVAPNICARRDELVALCGETMTSCVDRLELLAYATLEAQAALQATASGADLAELSREALNIRRVLVAEVRLLISRKLLPPGSIRGLPGTNGFRNQWGDLLQLTQLLLAHWDQVASRTGLTLDEVRNAEATAARLAMALGARDHALRSEAATMRLRAYSLMVSTYDDARRVISYLRWKEGDADRIAPSLYAGRSNGRGRREPVVTGPIAPPVVRSSDLPGADPFSGT